MRRLTTRELSISSVLAGLSALSEVNPGPPFDIPFPLMPQITWDFTGIPIMLSLFLCGPLGAIYTCIVGCSIILIRGNRVGWLFKAIAELSTVIGFAAFRKNVIIDSLKAVVFRVATMTVVNYYLLPFLHSIPIKVVLGILPLIAVFNATQAVINIVPAYLIFLRVKGLVKA